VAKKKSGMGLESKIINMADRLKDEEDRKLEALFASEPIADDGFSARVMARVRRQIWVRRLSLPLAFVIGASIAARPLMQLVDTLAGLLEFIPRTLASNLEVLPTLQAPQMQSILLGILLLLAAMTAGKLVNR
jgi:hypothetical protein